MDCFCFYIRCGNLSIDAVFGLVWEESLANTSGFLVGSRGVNSRTHVVRKFVAIHLGKCSFFLSSYCSCSFLRVVYLVDVLSMLGKCFGICMRRHLMLSMANKRGEQTHPVPLANFLIMVSACMFLILWKSFFYEDWSLIPLSFSFHVSVVV